MPITVGQTVEGRLEQGDWTDVFGDASYTDLYEINLEPGQGITVDLSSEAFDTYLSILRGPGDQLVDNDDITPENTNSRLSYRSQAAGRYFIAVTSFRTGATGAYTVRVTELRPQDEESGSKNRPATPEDRRQKTEN